MNSLASFPPSTYAIEDLLAGVPGAVPRVVGLTVLRALIIAPGIYVGAPTMPAKQLVKASFAVSVSVSIGMAFWYSLKKGDAPRTRVD